MMLWAKHSTKLQECLTWVILEDQMLKNMLRKALKIFLIYQQPIINKAGCNLSFAGLKTAVLRESKKINEKNKDDKQLRYNLAASFQHTINKILKKN